jgi:hypothetical protein
MEWSCCRLHPSTGFYGNGGRQRRKEKRRYNNRLSLSSLHSALTLFYAAMFVSVCACVLVCVCVYITSPKRVWNIFSTLFFGFCFLRLHRKSRESIRYLCFFKDLGHILEYELDRWDNRLDGRFLSGQIDWIRSHDGKQLENAFLLLLLHLLLLLPFLFIQSSRPSSDFSWVWRDKFVVKRKRKNGILFQ